MSGGEYVICLVFAVLVGLISIRFVRPVVIASTALSGGFSAVGTALTAMSPDRFRPADRVRSASCCGRDGPAIPDNGKTR